VTTEGYLPNDGKKHFGKLRRVLVENFRHKLEQGKRTGFPSSGSGMSGLKIAAWFRHRQLPPNVEFAGGDRL
jgi:hypothetical protein